MYRITILIGLIFMGACGTVFSQGTGTKTDKPWQFEIEPSTFFLGGFSFHVGRILTQDNKLSMAFYTLATNVPDALQKQIFNNTDADDDVRVGLQLTLNTRYKIDLFKGRESNPYVGLVTGWEYFNVTNPTKDDLRVDVLLLTPYIGGEIYLYKDVFYINPQIRSVIYLNPEYSIANRTETIKKVFILPQVSIGLRL